MKARPMPLTELPLNSEIWNKFILQQPNVNIFHHPSWIEFLVECYGYTPYLLTSLVENGKMQGGIPMMEINSWLTGRRMISLPFSDSCSPMAVDEKNLDKLILDLQQWRRQKGLSELQIRWPLSTRIDAYSGESFYQHFTYLNDDPAKVFRMFSKAQVQRHIRQSEKLGVVIKRGETLEDMYLFYNLHLRTRRRLGVPVQPIRFFRILWERLISQGLGFILLAYQEQQLLAGAVFLHFNETLTYKFGASDPKFWKFRPNDAIFWNAICWGCENGYKLFDWGRTDIDNDGLRDFKRGWGSEEQSLHYTILADSPPLHTSRFEVPRRLLTTIIQRSPVWMCRLIGELFYSHSA